MASGGFVTTETPDTGDPAPPVEEEAQPPIIHTRGDGRWCPRCLVVAGSHEFGKLLDMSMDTAQRVATILEDHDKTKPVRPPQ